MKLLVLMSSYRKSGNTARIAQMIVDSLRERASSADDAFEVEPIHLAHADLQPCRGCRACFDRGEADCPIKDDMPAIKAAMQAAHVVLVASPVYVEDVNGVMKNWMDRLAHVNHRPEFAGKYAYLITTSGLRSTNHAIKTLRFGVAAWGFCIAGQSRFDMGALMPRAEIETRYGERARQIAGKIRQAVASQRAAYPSLLSLIVFRVQQHYWRRHRDESIDCAYWMGKGWLDPRRDYYIPHRVSRPQVALARLAASAIARFVL